MVVGKQGLGKTTLLKTIFESSITPKLEGEDKPNQFNVFAPTDSIQVHSLEIDDEEGNHLQIDAIDTPGFSDDVDPEEVCNKIMNFVEKTYDEVFEEESRVRRNPKFEEHRVHAILYLIEPTGLDLKSVDAEFIKKLSVRSNVIPLIAKADALTAVERQKFKQQLATDFARHNINVYTFADFADSESFPGFEITKEMQPLSVIGSVDPRPADGRKGRPYPWGMAECDNPAHCDLKTFTTALFTVFRDELKEITEDALYEKYRTEKLEQGDAISARKSAEKIVFQEKMAL